jgi:hypothetical protein
VRVVRTLTDARHVPQLDRAEPALSASEHPASQESRGPFEVSIDSSDTTDVDTPSK